MTQLSIVTICYQDLEGLKKTIESLAKQKRADFEQIIVDGGSSDGTKEYLEKLKVPWSLSWISEKDRGLYDAMNKGTAKAHGSYVWFLNSGDVCSSADVVSKILTELKTPTDVLYGKAWYVGIYGRKSVGKPVALRDFLKGMPICHQSTIYRTEILREFPYPLEYRIIADWVVTEKVFRRAKSTRFIDFYIADFDLGGISAQNHLKVFREKLRSEETFMRKLQVLVFVGGKFLTIWSLKKLKIYSWIQQRRHQI